MVLTKDELIQSLQHEVHILKHLMTKVEPKMLDYRPTPKQRSTIELLRYLSFMGPTLLAGIKGGGFDVPAWDAAEKAAAAMSFDQVSAAVEKQSETYAQLVGSISDADLRTEIDAFGRKYSRGAHIVNLILCACAAYRTQLFIYLKANGRDELNTWNLWAGTDGSMGAAS